MDFQIGSFSHTLLHHEDVEVGKYTAIGANCIFHGSDNHITVIEPKRVSNNIDTTGYSKGKIIIENDVWIGDGVRILSGVHIGNGVIVGAGAVVANNIDPYAIAVGNPAKCIKYRFNQEAIEKLLKIRWWDWEPDLVAERKEDFEDIDIFLKKHAEFT